MSDGLVITANLATWLLIEHFELLSAPTHGPNARPVVWALLMAGGVFLISRF